MINPGSTVVIRTEKATYSPCLIVATSKDNVTVSFFKGVQRNGKGGWSQETIARKDIKYMSERL